MKVGIWLLRQGKRDPQKGNDHESTDQSVAATSQNRRYIAEVKFDGQFDGHCGDKPGGAGRTKQKEWPLTERPLFFAICESYGLSISQRFTNRRTTPSPVRAVPSITSGIPPSGTWLSPGLKTVK